MVEALYLHVPFCKSICYYCDFNRSLYDEKVVDRWLNQIQRELKQKQMNTSLKTIYIGGGTPTSLNFKQLSILLESLRPYTDNLEEYTIESNLESIDEDKLKLLQSYGVNRISLGVQSYNDSLLEIMNRKHHKSDIDKIIDKISIFIPNISIDLIYGFKEQSMTMWINTLKQAIHNDKIKHISIYSLTIEEHSIFSKKGIESVDNEIEAKMYKDAIAMLEQAGFKQYEVANFARMGFQSKHNQYYWRYEDFYGIGVGASGKENHKRYDNDFTMTAYLDGDRHPTIETLSKKDEMFEFIMMNLRLRKGLDIKRYDALFSVSFVAMFKELLASLEASNEAKIQDDYLVIGEAANMYLHDILIQFMEVIDERETIG